MQPDSSANVYTCTVMHIVYYRNILKYPDIIFFLPHTTHTLLTFSIAFAPWVSFATTVFYRKVATFHIFLQIMGSFKFILSPLFIRLVHALLPVNRRQRLALKAAGISTDDTGQEELEHLVQRERGVVWADQENMEEKAKPDEFSENNCLQPILCFSHLMTHQNTPCSEWRKVSSFRCALRTAGYCRPDTV